MSLFESSITGNILNDGSTMAQSGITAEQLSLVLLNYTTLTETATNTASISANATGVANNATAIAALQTQVDNLPTSALCSWPLTWLRRKGIAANASSAKSTPASVDAKLELLRNGSHEFGHHQRQQRVWPGC